jgi:hypothetical protein
MKTIELQAAKTSLIRHVAKYLSYQTAVPWQKRHKTARIRNKTKVPSRYPTALYLWLKTVERGVFVGDRR